MVQKIKEDTIKIQLATLLMGDTTLLQWESQTQVDLLQHGRIIFFWVEFIYTLRKQFYPLAYTQTSMIEWLHLRHIFLKNVQYYTQEFKKKTLALVTSLHSRETLIKYIGGLHSYLHYTILMFNPTNIDEVLIQTTHLKASKMKHGMNNVYKKPPKFEKQSQGKDHYKNIQLQ